MRMFIQIFKKLTGGLCGLALLGVMSGCAVLSGGAALDDEEKAQVIGQFKKMVETQGVCSCCIDADVSVRFTKLFGSAAISGSLQGREPAFLRFEGVNPLGMTEVVAGLNREDFHLFNVRQGKAYVGKISADTLKKYIPTQYILKYPYYWLIGRIPPGPVTIFGVMRDDDSEGYWVDVVFEQERQRGRILFDSHPGRVLQNILLADGGAVQARFVYGYDTTVSEDEGSISQEVDSCPYPATITLDEYGNGTVLVSIQKSYNNVTFEARDFAAKIPNGFEREKIE